MRTTDRGWQIKQRTLDLVRRGRLLEVADAVRARWVARRGRSARAAFLAAHPDEPLPPDDLAYDAYGSLDWDYYWRFGRQVAEIFAQTIRQQGGRGRVLEWGCGPARIIRHLPEFLGAGWDIAGCDANPRSVAWCASHLKGATFAENGAAPPLPFPSAYFDAAYAVSVFTHLSEPMHRAWADELHRVLKPGGVLICTLNGPMCRSLLLPAERARFDDGRLVVRGTVTEGTRCFLAYHPVRFVTDDLLRGFEIISREPPPNYLGGRQDIWIMRRP